MVNQDVSNNRRQEISLLPQRSQSWKDVEQRRRTVVSSMSYVVGERNMKCDDCDYETTDCYWMMRHLEETGHAFNEIRGAKTQ